MYLKKWIYEQFVKIVNKLLNVKNLLKLLINCELPTNLVG